MTAADWINRLDLVEHPEGGYYREAYRSTETIAAAALPERFGGDRPVATSIYFLITRERPSRFHRLHADEVWYHHAGATLTLHLLHEESGAYDALRLGVDAGDDVEPQRVVSAGTWFGASVEEGAFALVGCAVAPGFHFDDFEIGEEEALHALFPAHRSIIARLTNH